MSGADTGRSLASIIGGGYDDFWYSRARYRVVKGGKASKKSTTAALWYIVHMMKYPGANLLVIRRVMDTHRNSTLASLQLAVERLGVSHLWRVTRTPLEMVYKPTGQKILFRGFDDWQKLASITVPVGHLCWVWIEEAYELEREDEFEKLDLSVPRGMVAAPLFKQTTLTFNPWNEHHWLKSRFFDAPPPDALVMTTNYLCNEWLDETDRAIYERMRQTAPRQYDVAGLGNWGVAEGLVFENWEVAGFELAQVTGEKPWQWRHIFGLDYGYTNDPTAFIAAAANPIEKRLYIYDEHYAAGMLNSDIAAMILHKHYQKERIRADSAEPKSNEELRRLGIRRVAAAEKGADSVRNGVAALQEYRITIHPLCKNTAAEIAAYCWKTDKAGRRQNEPEDRNNHLMDALRYAMEDVKSFRPPEREPEKPRRRRDGVTAGDFKGGWS